MRIGILGANFKSSPLGIREKLAWASQRRFSCLSREAAELSCVVLSTCNRIELYFSAEDLAEAHSVILGILKEEIELPFEHHLYAYFGIDCFLHLAEVTAGLDSAIVAETDIQRQVKQAYETRGQSYSLASCIHYLFQKSLHLGKHVRSHCLLTSRGVTLPQLLFDLGGEVLSEIHNVPILLIGYSEINRQVISFLKYKGCRQLTLCSRSAREASEFSLKEGIRFLPWKEKESWVQFPWVIVGSNAPGYLIRSKPGEMQTQLICDLSMPRAVDPHLSENPQIVMYDMEALVNRIALHQKTNQEEFTLAKNTLSEKVSFYEQSFFMKKMESRVCV